MTTEQTTLTTDSTDNDHLLTLESTDTLGTYQDMCMLLTLELEDLNPDSNEYTARGEDVTWRRVSGTTTVTLETGQDLVEKLAPSTEWTLEAETTEDALIITLYTHDEPWGATHEIRAK